MTRMSTAFWEHRRNKLTYLSTFACPKREKIITYKIVKSGWVTDTLVSMSQLCKQNIMHFYNQPWFYGIKTDPELLMWKAITTAMETMKWTDGKNLPRYTKCIAHCRLHYLKIYVSIKKKPFRQTPSIVQQKEKFLRRWMVINDCINIIYILFKHCGVKCPNTLRDH